jgi:hypothetical protein
MVRVVLRVPAQDFRYPLRGQWRGCSDLATSPVLLDLPSDPFKVFLGGQEG